MSTVIRPAREADASVIFELLKASAIEQGNLHELCVDEQAVRDDGFGPTPRFQAILAEWDGQVAGFALYYFNYSTWVSRNGLYLEDLYVWPEFRRRGVARSLMEKLAAIAIDRGCGRLQWVVKRENERAKSFYRSLGAVELTQWPLMWLTGGTLTKLAR